MKCILIDDEKLALQLLSSYAGKVPGLEVIAQCQGSLKALEVLKTQQPDLLLLDINMPNLNGFELINVLPQPPLVIIVSAHQEHALTSFEWEVVDFLLKPVSFERFVKAIQKAEQQLRLRSQPRPMPTEEARDHFFIRQDHTMIKVRYAEITHIESFREYAHVHTTTQKVIVKRPLKHFESLLAPTQFMRVHRSYIIALDKVDAVFGNRISIGPHEIPIGKSYKDTFFATIELL